MAWFSLAKIALQAGSKIYANRQKTKMAMSDAQLMHAENVWLEVRKLTRVNLLEARQIGLDKDEFVLIIIVGSDYSVNAWAVLSQTIPAAMEKVKIIL